MFPVQQTGGSELVWKVKKAHLFAGKMKLPELIKFAAPFALPKGSAKAERVLNSQTKNNINSKKIDTGFKMVDGLEDLDK